MNARIAMLILGLMSIQSHAALQSVNWKVAGDNKATLDTNTGIEWLDITETDGKSVDYVLSQLGVGGRYQGWRLPSEAEVLNLINSHFNTSFNGTTNVQFNGLSAVDGALWSKTRTIYETLGTTFSRGGTWGYSGYDSYMYGKYVANDGVTVKVAGSNSWVSSGEGFFRILGGYGNYSKSFVDRNEEYGVFLVSDGGLTFSSQLNPMLNINNPAAPINQPPAGSVSLTSLLTGTNYADATLEYTPSGVSGFSGFKYKINGGEEQTSSGSTISLTGLTAGTSYTLSYAAYNSGGTGTWYTATVTTQAPPAPVSSPMTIAAGLAMFFMGFRRNRK